VIEETGDNFGSDMIAMSREQLGLGSSGLVISVIARVNMSN
jgi:hypothetical protein